MQCTVFWCADSSSDDDSVFDEEQLRGFQRGGGARDSGASSSSYSDHGQGASPYHHASSTPQGGGGGAGGGERPRSQHYANYAIPGNTARHALADVMQNAQNARHCKYTGKWLWVVKKSILFCSFWCCFTGMGGKEIPGFRFLPNKCCACALLKLFVPLARQAWQLLLMCCQVSAKHKLDTCGS